MLTRPEVPGLGIRVIPASVVSASDRLCVAGDHRLATPGSQEDPEPLYPSGDPEPLLLEPPQSEEPWWRQEQETPQEAGQAERAEDTGCTAMIGEWRFGKCLGQPVDPRCQDLGHELPTGERPTVSPKGAEARGKLGEQEQLVDPLIDTNCYCDCYCVYSFFFLGMEVTLVYPKLSPLPAGSPAAVHDQRHGMGVLRDLDIARPGQVHDTSVSAVDDDGRAYAEANREIAAAGFGPYVGLAPPGLPSDAYEPQSTASPIWQELGRTLGHSARDASTSTRGRPVALQGTVPSSIAPRGGEWPS